MEEPSRTERRLLTDEELVRLNFDWFSSSIGADILFAQKRTDAPDRCVLLEGELIEVGEDETGQWILVHLNSIAQLETLLDGELKLYANQSFFDATCGTKTPLPVPNEPQKFPVKEVLSPAIF